MFLGNNQRDVEQKIFLGVGRTRDMGTSLNAIVFDIDGTLCTYPRSHGEVLEKAFDRVGVEPIFPVDGYLDRFEATLEDCNSITNLRERIFTALAEEHGADPRLGRAVARAFEQLRGPRDAILCDGARTVLEGLDDSYQLGVVTNAPPENQRVKLADLSLDSYFETVVCGGFDAAAKPDPEPFELAMERMNVDPASTLYVGNSLEHDVVGARAAGMKTAWLDDGSRPDPAPDVVLDSLDSLLAEPWSQ